MSALAKPGLKLSRVYCSLSLLDSLQDTVSAQGELLPLPSDFPHNQTEPSVVIVDSPRVFSPELRSAVENNETRVIYVLSAGSRLPREARDTPVFAVLTFPVESASLQSAVVAAHENLRLAHRQSELEEALERSRAEIDELNEIGIALSSQHDTGTLLEMILRKSREITRSDAGSLYLIDESEANAEPRLRFILTQNFSIPVKFTEFSIPINSSSIAGYVAKTGEMIHLEDVYNIPPSLPFRFMTKFDQDSGYRTKSMLVVPLKNPKGEILGVLQLINCKRYQNLRVTPETADDIVVPYPESRRNLISSLASQAAVALENNRLVENIETLFEGFVKASVTAIESRDPTTSGHSFRVADLTVGLAEAVDRCDWTPFREVKFSFTEMKEIRYASLLHDFGKVGVREEVLVKAKKLYPQQFEAVRYRFDFVRKAIQQKASDQKLAYLLEKGRNEYLAQQPKFDAELAEELRLVDDYLRFLMKCNEPTVLPEGDFRRLAELASFRFNNWDGEEQPLITPFEAQLLSIPKGSLDSEERNQIESHVVHTYNFLSQIPWTKEIKNIPAIARAHHEKLDGSGYPYNLKDPEIPLQSKLMTVSDIYDALSATDRPYKKAVPSERALDILGMEANQNLIDPQIYRLFVDAEIYKRTIGWSRPASA